MPSAYTIVEMVEVDDATHAKCRFIAVDFKSKKTRGILTGKMRHKTIFGWIDEKGRWYN